MSTEADTCRTYIVPKLHTAGWEDEYISEQMTLTPGRIVPIGDRYLRKEGLKAKFIALWKPHKGVISVLDRTFRESCDG